MRFPATKPVPVNIALGLLMSAVTSNGGPLLPGVNAMLTVHRCPSINGRRSQLLDSIEKCCGPWPPSATASRWRR